MTATMRRAWNTMARPYQAFHAIPADRIHYGPNVPLEDELGLLGSLRGTDVLEVGCGGGQNAVAFKRQGARRVVGVDLSDAQVAHARALAERLGVEVQFEQGPADDLRRFLPASFDVVFSAGCFQFVPDFGRTCREVSRVLRPGGRFAFSHDHPIVGMTGADGVTLRRSYFARTASWTWRLPNGARSPMTTIYRSVEETFDALRAAGLVVERIIEPQNGRARAGRWPEPTYRQRRFPATIIFLASKPAAARRSLPERNRRHVS